MLGQFKTKGAKGIISILTGGIISKVIWAFFGLILSKFYGPENFGIYNVFIGYLAILSVIGTFRLEHILVISKSPNEIFNFYKFLLFISTLGIALLVLISYILWFFSSDKKDGLTTLVWLVIFLGSIFSSWILIQNALFTKFRFFQSISIGLIISTFVSVFFQSLFYFVFPEEIGFYGLILGYLLGLIASVVYYFKTSRTKSLKFPLKDAKNLIQSNKEILKFVFPSESINTLANNLFIILAAIYFNQIEVGVFALALKILSTPLILIFNAFSKVYFQKSAQLFHSQKTKLWMLTLKVSFYSGGLILLFLIVINTLGIYILNLFYESKSWPNLDLYLLSISFWIFMRGVVGPISQIVIVIKKNKLSLWMNIGLFLSNLIGIFVGVLYKNFILSILIFSFTAGVIYLFFYITVLYYLKQLHKG